MKKVRIIADSASDLPQNYHPDLTVIPLCVMFGETEYLDGVTLSHKEFYEKLVEGDTLPHTSQITELQFREACEEALKDAETAVIVTLSGKLSNTALNAKAAAEHFPGKVFAVDSENAAVGEGVQVRRALELAEQGVPAREIAETLEREKKDVRLVALVNTLEYLKRGGRLSATSAFVGEILNIKPVIAVRDGEVVVLGKARGSRNGNNFLIKEIEATNGIDAGRPYALAYGGLSDELLKKYIVDSHALWNEHTDELPVFTIGGTIGTHVGPGAIAVAFYQKEA